MKNEPVPVTLEDIDKWSSFSRVYIIPLVIAVVSAAVIGTGTFYAIRGDLVASIESNRKQDADIAILAAKQELNYTKHNEKIIRMEASADAFRDTLKQFEVQIDRRFAELTTQLNAIGRTLEALLMRQRVDK